MAALTGTEKQIAWAEDIRSAYLKRAERDLEMARRDAVDDVDRDEIAMLERGIAAAKQQVSAKWWIETRVLKPIQVTSGLAGAKDLRALGITVAPEFAEVVR